MWNCYTRDRSNRTNNHVEGEYVANAASSDLSFVEYGGVNLLI